MIFTDVFRGWFNKDIGTLPLDVCIGQLAGEIYYKELALQACINLISSAISSSEFQTYEKGKEVRRNNYYALNVEPNLNQSSSVFWTEVITKLIRQNECLVLQQDDSFYVADSFDIVDLTFKERIYKNITIKDYDLDDSFPESRVWYFKLNDKNIQMLIDGINESYSKLITASRKGYVKGKGKRGTLAIGTDYPQTDDAQKLLQDLMDNKFKRFFEAEGDAVIPLGQGLTYQELAENSKGGSSNSSRETRAFIDDIFDFVAMSLNIPTQLLKSNVADTSEVMNIFMSLCVNPIAKLITDEVNRKMYGKESYLQRTYAKLNTSRVKVTDLKDIANPLDVLTRIGANTIDDSLKMLGLEPLNTEWSQARFMTKNYMPVSQMLKEGG